MKVDFLINNKEKESPGCFVKNNLKKKGDKTKMQYRLNSILNIFLLCIHIFLYVFPNANIVYMINFVIVALPVVL